MRTAPCPTTCDVLGIPVGLRSYALPAGADQTFTVTAAMLLDGIADTPLLGLRFTGTGLVFPRVVLPKPALLSRSYTLLVENRGDEGIILANDPTTGDTVTLDEFQTTETSMDSYVANAAATYHQYRTQLLVTPDGVYRVPGFSAP